MINNFKKPDLNAPRYREKVLSILNTETLTEFKDKYPIYKNISNDKLKKVIKLFNENIWKEVIISRLKTQWPKYYKDLLTFNNWREARNSHRNNLKN